jgi:hypothetical protein
LKSNHYVYPRNCHLGIAERLAHRHGAEAFCVHDSTNARPVFRTRRVCVYVTLLTLPGEVCGRFLVGHMQGHDETITTGFVPYDRAVPQDWFSDDDQYDHDRVIAMDESTVVAAA